MKGKPDRPAKVSPKISGPLDAAEAERIAVGALDYLAGEAGRLTRFLDATGLSAPGLRAAAAEPGFLAGVLDHVVGDEALLVACAGALAIPPERLAAAWRRLSPQEFE